MSGALNTQGALVADVTAVNHTFPQFDAPFPLYPDGAVMLTLPVSVPTGAPETDEVELSISYMACSSDGGCKLPVTDHRVTVRLPAEIWQ
ncbi:MAG: hypothetical protein GY943_28030 [Chloroflexi bacterium]|nr:hypothetical protein [Chloroflexota bacterium]